MAEFRHSVRRVLTSKKRGNGIAVYVSQEVLFSLKMIVNPGYLINIQELDEILNHLNNIVSENLNEGGIIDQRFSGISILINMLFEKIEKLTVKVDTLSVELLKSKKDNNSLNNRVNWYRELYKKLLADQENLRAQVESNVIALNLRMDELTLNSANMKI